MLNEAFRDIINKFLNYIKFNTGKFLGITIGVIVGIMVITMGFIKTVFIILCAAIGYAIGDKIDEGENLKDIMLKWFSKND